MAVNPSLETRDIDEMLAPTGNIYETIAIIGKRSRQLSSRMKEELSGKLAEFATTVDNLEEIFENREQIEISKFYERMPKPSLSATEEFLNGELQFRMAEDEEQPASK